MPNQITYPNQRMIHINREKPTANFLGIKNENWQAAARDLRPHALLLYLYIASNADNYSLALSPAAARQEIGMARSTFHDQFHILVDKGYLVPTTGNRYEFYEKPQTSVGNHMRNNELSSGLDFENNPTDDQPIQQGGLTIMTEDIEINNITTKNKAPTDINTFYF